MAFEQLVGDLTSLVNFERLASGTWYDPDEGAVCPLGQIGMKRGIFILEDLIGEKVEGEGEEDYITNEGSEEVVIERLASFYSVSEKTIRNFFIWYDDMSQVFGPTQYSVVRAIDKMVELKTESEVIDYDEN